MRRIPVSAVAEHPGPKIPTMMNLHRVGIDKGPGAITPQRMLTKGSQYGTVNGNMIDRSFNGSMLRGNPNP